MELNFVCALYRDLNKNLLLTQLQFLALHCQQVKYLIKNFLGF